MRVSRVVIAAAVLISVASLTACSSDGSSSATTTTKLGGRAKGASVAIVIKDSTGLSGPMTMTVSPDSVGHGVVTFMVRNAGTIRHQLVVLRSSAAVLTPGASQRVSEHWAVGAIRLLRPGVTTSLTVKLAAGKYQLLCNLPGHYARGLHVPLTVT